MSKIDITSTAVEKGIEAAKEFLNKLVGPTIEESGLLIKDRITFWRFKNQVKMINKAQKYCIENNISPKNIPLKMLHPIMEYSALEEAEELQDKWAVLLSNMVDSDQNIENHVFPYILSQISIKEYQLLETVVLKRFLERKNLNSQLSRELEANTSKRVPLEEELEKVTKLISELPKEATWEEKREFRNKQWDIKWELRKINAVSEKLKQRIKAPISIPQDELEEFEFSNLRRLGVIKGISKQVATLENSEISFDRDSESVSLEDIEIVVEHDYEEYIVTQLGEIFIDVCTEKKEKSN